MYINSSRKKVNTSRNDLLGLQFFSTVVQTALNGSRCVRQIETETGMRLETRIILLGILL